MRIGLAFLAHRLHQADAGCLTNGNDEDDRDGEEADNILRFDLANAEPVLIGGP